MTSEVTEPVVGAGPSADDEDRGGTGVPLRIAAAVAAGTTLLWVVAAILCAPRGLDVSDESFYLLSYRWWDVNFDTFTGAQYFYGPVFQLLGHDIALLRVFKVATLLASHGFLGWEFMRWLRLHRPSAPPTRWWEAAGAIAIMACSGAVYSWLPLSPGYNDLILTATAVAAGLTLRIARAMTIGRRAPWWASFALGALAVVMVLTKWSSSLLVLSAIGLVIVILALTSRVGWRAFAILAGLIVAGAVVAVAAINFLLVPLATMLPPMRAVNAIVAGSSNSPATLLSLYWDTAVELAKTIVKQHTVLLLAALVIPFLRSRWIAALLAVLALGTTVLQVLRHDGLRAGSHNLGALTVTLFTPLVAIALAALAGAVARRLRERGTATSSSSTQEALGRWAVYGLLLALPIAQAAGTGNPVHYLALTGMGIWMAVAIAVATAYWDSIPGARTLLAGTLVVLMLATSLIAVDGLWNHPYRTTGHSVSTAVAEGVPALSSLRLEPNTARDYSDLHRLLRPYIEPEGRAMMAFDTMAGIVLLLDARPVGEAWYSAAFPQRSAAGIRRACADGTPWWGDRKPLVLFNRKVTNLERRALAACDLSLTRDYQKLSFVRPPQWKLAIYVPNEEVTP